MNGAPGEKAYLWPSSLQADGHPDNRAIHRINFEGGPGGRATTTSYRGLMLGESPRALDLEAPATRPDSREFVDRRHGRLAAAPLARDVLAGRLIQRL